MLNMKNKLAKRIMAFVLSGAMVLSGIAPSGMTAYAAETSTETVEGYVEATEETDAEVVSDKAEEETPGEDSRADAKEEANIVEDVNEEASKEETGKETASTSEAAGEAVESSVEGKTEKDEGSSTPSSETTESGSTEESSGAEESSGTTENSGADETDPAPSGKRIDVWDFGAKLEEDTNTYRNNITADSWNNYANLGTDGKFTAAGEAVFGDLTLNYVANDRVYSSAANKTAGTPSGAAVFAYSDEYTAAGDYYCNGTGGSNRRHYTINNVLPGDRIDAYVGSSDSKATNFYFEYLGTEGTQKDIGSIGTTNEKLSFVAKYAGSYKIWADTSGGKPITNRVKRVPAVDVSGTIDLGPLTSAEGITLKFANETTNEETVATLDGTSFTVKLAAGYSYNAAITGKVGYGPTNASKKINLTDADALTGKSGIQIVIEEKRTYVYSGTIKGFAADYGKKPNLKVIMKTAEDVLSDDVELTITGLDSENPQFTGTLEPDVEYTITLEGVNDYQVKTPKTVSGTEAHTEDIEVELRPTYEAKGSFVDLEGNAVTGVTALTFKNVDDEYEYTATIAEDGKSYTANLRDGIYSAQAAIEKYVTKSHVIVEGKAVSKDILFVSTETEGALTRVADLYVGYADKGDANYATVNKAVKAAKRMNPTKEDERITIHIAPGVYREQIIVDVPYISFVNDTPDKEVKLTWYQGIGYQYYSSVTGWYDAQDAHDQYKKGEPKNWGACVQIKSTGFLAEDIVFEHSLNRYITDEELADGVEPTAAGGKPVRDYALDVASKAATERGCAMFIDTNGNNAEFYHCKFLSSQDTIGTGKKGAHAYFKECFIEGGTDYICYDGDTIFDNCVLNFKGYSDSGSGGYITAAQDSAENGYLFWNCTVTGNKDMIVDPGYFGRPWSQGAKVTFVNTKLERADIILPVGWTSMSSATPEKANFKEYNTTSLDGNAVDTSQRTAGTVLTENPVPDVDAFKKYFGGWTPKHYVEEAAAVEFVTNPEITNNGDMNHPLPGNTLTVKYSLGTANDANDASVIKWYRVKEGEDPVLVKASTAQAGKTYKIQKEDVGFLIKVEVTPTVASGKAGTAASFQTEVAVSEGWEEPGQGDAVLGDGINIFLAGDSTVKDYSAKGMYNGGKAQDLGSWGEFIQEYFNSEKVTIVNYAQGGRSTRNFMNEGKLKNIQDNIGEGDYLFIQFGHNDCAANYPDRFVPIGEPDANGIYPTTEGTADADGQYAYNCGGTFKWFLKEYIKVAKDAGATPVLVTPVARMYYDADGKIRAHHDCKVDASTPDNTYASSNNAYVEAYKQVAQEENVILLDAFAITKKMYEDAYTAAGADTYGKQIMGLNDSTHCNKLGGFIEAGLLVEGIKALKNADGNALNITTAIKKPAQVLGKQVDGTTVFTINAGSKLTAYDFTADPIYSTETAYWTTIGQELIDSMGTTANPDPTPGPDVPTNPDQPSTSEKDPDKIQVDSGDKTISIDNKDKITIAASDVVYTKKQPYVITVTYKYTKDGKPYQQQLTEGLHYTVESGSNDLATEGSKTVTLIGTKKKTDLGTFTGETTVTYTVLQKKDNSKTNISTVKALSLDKNEIKNLSYTGGYITPEVQGVGDLGENCKIVYKNNVNAGKASATVVGQGEYYGTKVLTYTIKPADLSKPEGELKLFVSDKEITQDGKAYNAGEFAYKGSPVTLENLITLKYKGIELRPKEDYTITYKVNVQKLTGTATIKGINNFKGSIKIDYKMKEDPKATTAELTKLTEVPAEYSSKGARLTKIELDNGTLLKENVDYKVTYDKACKDAQVNDTLSIKIKGIGAYNGKIEKDTVIAAKVVKGDYHIKDNTIVDMKKSTSSDKFINAAKITDASGAKVKPANITVKVLANGAYKDYAANESFTTIKVIPTDTAKYNEEGTILSCRVAEKLSGSQLVKKAKIADQPFDGVNSVTLTEKRIENYTGLKAGDIRIVSYKNNNKLGSATVTIEGRESSPYYGTATLKFKIALTGSDRKPEDEENESSSTGGSTENPSEPSSGEEKPSEPSSGEEKPSEPSSGEEKPSEPSSGEENPSEPASEIESEPPVPDDQKHTVWMVGDSTVSAFTDNYYYPRYGYGTQLQNYLDGYYTVKNIAASGRSSISYITDEDSGPLYTDMKSKIKSGDILIIGFGHNDEKQGEDDRFTDPTGDWQTEGSFAKSLYDNYVKVAEDKGATAIICTPIVRRTTDEYKGSAIHITSNKEVNGKLYKGGSYPDAIKKLGQDKNVKVVDLTTLTKAAWESLGNDGTLKLHAWQSNKDTSVDSTHLNIYGAKKVAYILATEIAKFSDLDIASHVKTDGKEPTEKDLVPNPDYKIPDVSGYQPPTGKSEYWENYGIFKGTVFGTVNKTINDPKYHQLDTDADGNMHIAALEGSTKIGSKEDGRAMYYYQIPATSTFEFSAKAKINSIVADNQVGFGLMARDDMFIDQKGEGILSDYVAAGTFGTGSTNSFMRKDGVLKKGPALGADVKAGETYSMSIVKNTDGYACTFGDNVAQSGGYDFQLAGVDAEYQYIGMFVSRNADITFSDIKLTVDGKEIDIMDTTANPEPDVPTGDDLTVDGNGGEVEISKEDGFKTGKTYGYKNVATFKVLQDMPFLTQSDKGESYAITVDGKEYSGVVQGKANPSDSHTVQSGTSAVFEITAVTNSKITFITRENQKNLYFVDVADVSDKDRDVIGKNRPTEGGKSRTFEMKAGHTYQFYAGGSKVMVAAISIAKAD